MGTDLGVLVGLGREGLSSCCQYFLSKISEHLLRGEEGWGEKKGHWAMWLRD